MNLKELQQYINKARKVLKSELNESFKRESYYYLRLMKQFTPIDKGKLRDSWNIELRDNNTEKIGNITNSRNYATHIEFGSKPKEKPWPNPGERTAKENGRIFSIQAMGGVSKNAFNENDVQVSAEHTANSLLNAFR